jgi:hypothetical protein
VTWLKKASYEDQSSIAMVILLLDSAPIGQLWQTAVAQSRTFDFPFTI